MNDLHSFVLLVSCSETEWWLGLHHTWDLLFGSTDRKSNRFGMSQGWGNYFKFTTITLITLLTVILVLCRDLGKLKYKFEQEKKILL